MKLTNDFHVPNPMTNFSLFILDLSAASDPVGHAHLETASFLASEDVTLSSCLTGSSSSPWLILLTSLTANAGIPEVHSWIALPLHLYSLFLGGLLPPIALMFHVLSTPKFTPVAPSSPVNSRLMYPTAYWTSLLAVYQAS